jgi:hypothetical protein
VRTLDIAHDDGGTTDDLLARVLNAHGGLDEWRTLTGLTAKAVHRRPVLGSARLARPA